MQPPGSPVNATATDAFDPANELLGAGPQSNQIVLQELRDGQTCQSVRSFKSGQVSLSRYPSGQGSSGSSMC